MKAPEPESPGRNRFRHLPQLDGMRAAAILIVMMGHAYLLPGIPGGFGVTLFFFLSGYLITSLLRIEAEATGRISLKGFYLRRTVRIVPPMVLSILATLLVQRLGLLPEIAQPQNVLADLLFLSNYNKELGTRLSVQIPLWSLDVEEHFYIIFSSLFALWLGRKSPAKAALACAAMCLAVLLIRCATVFFDPGSLERIYYWSHTRIDSILFGSILALWRNPVIDENPLRPGPGMLLGAILVLAACLVVREPVFRETLRYSLQGAALLVVFAWVLNLRGKASSLLGCWPLRWVALLSYTLYLIHFPALRMAEGLDLPFTWVWGYVIAFLFAMAMHWLVEKPLGRWRHRVERKLVQGMPA